MKQYSLLGYLLVFALLNSAGLLFSQSKINSNKIVSNYSKEDQDFINSTMKDHHSTVAQADSYLQLKKKDDQSIQLFSKKEAAATVQASCANLDFETGDLSSWTTSGQANIVSTADGNDPFGGFPQTFPGGNNSLKLGSECLYGTSVASQTFTVSAANALLYVNYAMVLLNYSGHTKADCARVIIEVLDPSGVQIPCTVDTVYALSTTPGIVNSGIQVGNTPPLAICESSECLGCKYDVLYKPWSTYGVDLSSYIGQSVTLRITDKWCLPNYDFAYSYFDCSCAPLIITATYPCGGTPFQMCGPANMTSYLWSQPGGGGVSGAATQCVSASVAGTYTLSLNTPGTCPPPKVYFTANPAASNPVVSMTASNVTCGGSNNGTATATVAGGNADYTYSWSDGTNNITASTSNIISNLPPATYVVTITDAGGCSSTSTAIVSPPNPVTASIAGGNAACNGGNGSATASVVGGNPNYTYSWSTGITWSTASTSNWLGNLPANTYVVTISDASGCTSTSAVVITEPPAVTATPGNTSTSCGSNNGSVFVTPGGGSGSGYNYLWTGGSPSQTVTNLGAGSYVVTVTDGAGCTITATTLVSSNGIPSATMNAPTNASCNGDSNGSATVTSSGGTAPYTYSWSTGASSITNSTTQQLTNLPAGTYIVTVNDATMCPSITNVVITDPPAVTAVSGSNSAACGVNNGSVYVTPGGGSGAGYVFLWTGGSPAQTTTGLGAGTYIVTVTDGAGCTATSTATINGLGGPTTTMGTPTNVSCNGGNNGSVTVTASAGTPPYTYVWSNGSSSTTTAASDQNINLAQGNYIVTVSDAGGCPSIANVTITEPAVINVTAIGGQAGCGMSNGTANVTNTTGGIAGYNYSWSSTAVGMTATALAAGPYIVTVTDANLCTATTTATVSNTTGPNAVMSYTAVTCFGGNNGSVLTTASNGASTYTYLWSTGASSITNSTTQQITNLVAGSYTVTVSDGSACDAVNVVTVTQPAKLQMGAGTISPTCFGLCNGTAVVAPQGWTPATTVWNTGGTGIVLTNLCIGTYSVTATDVNGCVKDTTLSITQPTKLTLTGNSTGANCNQSNGSAQVNGAGGTPGLNYSWSNNVTTSNNPNIASGNYTVTITDVNGCKHDTSFTIATIGGVTASIPTSQSATCFNGCNGQATAQGIGSGGYSYTWNTIPVQSTAVATNLCAGNYIVTVKDLNTCTSVANVTITEPPALTLGANTPTIICIGQSSTLNATGGGGTPAYNYTWTTPTGPQNGASIVVTPTVTTTYSVSVTDANNCTTVQQLVTVPVNPPLTITASVDQYICPGGVSTFSATASGGDNNLTYTWLPGSLYSQTLSTTPGANQTYTVIVNDGCGTPLAVDSADAILNPVPVVAFAGPASGCVPLCVSFQDNSTIANGTIVSWLWDFGSITSLQKNPQNCYAIPGTYDVTLTVTSDKNCSSTLTQTGIINAYPLPTAAFTADPKKVTILDPAINFTDNSTGATGWVWDFGDPKDSKNTSTTQNTSHTYSDTGSYTIKLIVTNANNCTDTILETVIIENDFTFYVPNAFTPNGDGINDIFNGKGIGIIKYKMLIFDRWGNLIYGTEDMNGGWDGTANGGSGQVQQDVYEYKIVLMDFTAKRHTYLGHVSMIK